MKNATNKFNLEKSIIFFSKWKMESRSFTFLLTLFFLLNEAFVLHAQNVTISLEVKNKNIMEVLSIIEKKCNIFLLMIIIYSMLSKKYQFR